MMTRVLRMVLFAVALGVPLHGQTPQPPATPDEFVPVSAPANPADTIPAPRLVAIAYGFIWVVLLAYVASVRTRLSAVEREMRTLSRRAGEGPRA